MICSLDTCGFIISSNLTQNNWMLAHLLGINLSAPLKMHPIEASTEFLKYDNNQKTIWNKFSDHPPTDKISIICVAIPLTAFAKDDGSGNNLVFHLDGK